MKKILVVDDKSSINMLLVQFLEKQYEVETKSDGFEALVWLQKGNIPDLILTDLQMPNMDGMELIKRIKERGYLKNIPIFVMSCKDSSGVRIQCLKMGAEDYMDKPFNPEELLLRIGKVIQR
jgi:DNA-binding response OmpR family regulator